MIIAVIKNGTVIDVSIFDTLQLAQSFSASGVWPGAETVLELPDGYGIGDSYDAQTGEWTKAPAPEPPEPEPEPERGLTI